MTSGVKRIMTASVMIMMLLLVCSASFGAVQVRPPRSPEVSSTIIHSPRDVALTLQVLALMTALEVEL